MTSYNNNNNNNNNNNEHIHLNAYESSKLTIDPNFFKLGMKLNDHDNNTYVLVHIRQRKEGHDNKQYEYCLTFRKITKQECSNCGYVDFTINPYCQKCFLSYTKIEDITNYGLHV